MRASRSTSRPQSLAGSLLLAHPSLQESTFRHTVILLSAHHDDGAVGVVLNRPLGRNLGGVDGSFALGPLAEVPVFEGGPVQVDQLILASWRLTAAGFQMQFGLDPVAAAQQLGDEQTVVRAFRGYSGWSGGQLENELRQNTWATSRIPPDLMSLPHDERLWRSLLSGLDGPWPLLAGEPDDPSQN